MKPIILIKTGGKVAVNGPELTSLIQEMKLLKDEFNFVLVHGGGAEVTKASKIYGFETEFINGVRMTTVPEMEIVDGVLAGRVNKRLVRNFEALDVKAVGLSGNDGKIFTGITKDSTIDNRTGMVTKTDPELLQLLLKANFIPIISSVSMEITGEPLNINADEAALAISESLKVDKVIFISDIPGILKNSEILHEMTPELIEKEIEAGVISGGMIPKVNASITAIKNGVHSVVISNYLVSGDLLKLIENKKGSIITLDKPGRCEHLLGDATKERV